MSWLVTGGAGYIGAHVVRALLADGQEVVVVDDLSTGLRRKVPADVPLVVADVRDVVTMERTLREHGVTGVVHLAARKAVGESVAQPLDYYRCNVEGMVALLEAMRAAEVRDIVHSSSASVYGDPQGSTVVSEDAPFAPTSPYGQTKVVAEWLVADAGVAYGMSWSALRYFNVVGAGGPDLGDTGAHNLVPLAFRAITAGRAPQVYGADYPTPDGSCIRDYVDVVDLAEAHVAAARRCAQGGAAEALNVGRGEGLSVLEVLAVVREVTGVAFEPELVGRRPGDPAAVVASAEHIADVLGWRARREVPAMVASAWEAWAAHPAL